MMRGQPAAERFARLLPETMETRAHLTLSSCFTKQDDVLRDLEKLVPPFVQIRCAATQCFLGNWLGASRRHEGIDCSLDQVLIQPASLVQLPESRLHAVSQGTSLGLRQTVN